ncbi:MAG: ATPase [Rhodobacteraceae bacterium]|nr:ATPase [Paracoccaceae bacterium]
MTPSLKKRFWKTASVLELENGFGIALDGRRVKTPARADLAVPVAEIAQMIAAEWDAQTDAVNPEIMPATRWANSAIDKVSVQRADVIAMLAEYGGSDLLCYRAEHPEGLLEQQKQAWDPLLAWAEKQLDARLETTCGVLPVEQSNHSLRKLETALEVYDSFQIAAIHDLVTISGSLVLALAVSKGEIPVSQAWKISRIDEDWQEKLWGTDEDAQISAKSKSDSFHFADKILQFLR